MCMKRSQRDRRLHLSRFARHSLDVHNAPDRFERAGYLFEMLEVEYLRGQNELTPALVIKRRAYVPNICANAGDGLGYVGNHAWTILGHQLHRYRVSRFVLRI